MTTILIVEDNKETQLFIAARLRYYFDVICVNDGMEALNVICKNNIDLIVTDITMPNMDGYEMIRRLRSQKNNTPVLIFSAKKSFEDKREGFESGADDYITKPANYDELFLRVNALLKRAHISVEKKIIFGSVIISSETYSVVWSSGSIWLTQIEFELLYILLSYPNIIFTPNQLIDDIWSFDSNITEDMVRVHINRLKNNLKSCREFEIITVGGVGYEAKIKINK